MGILLSADTRRQKYWLLDVVFSTPRRNITTLHGILGATIVPNFQKKLEDFVLALKFGENSQKVM